MPSYSCANCGQQVPVGSKACPHCGKPPHKSDAAGAGVAIGCLALIVLPIVFLVALGDESRSGSYSGIARERIDGAWAACTQAVEQRLRSPRSARFPWGYDDRVASLGGGRYRVRAYVDAANAFGAEVRTDFDCTVVWAGADQWRLDDLTLTPR